MKRMSIEWCVRMMGVALMMGGAWACVPTTQPASAHEAAEANAPVAPAHSGSAVLSDGHEPSPGAAQGHWNASHHEHSPNSAVDGDHEHAEHGASDEGSRAQVYTCPMHAEVRASEPGRCPKCGMNLEVSKEKKTKE